MTTSGATATWPAGKRAVFEFGRLQSWKVLPDQPRTQNQAKPITEIPRAFQEEAFPGYTRFIGDRRGRAPWALALQCA